MTTQTLKANHNGTAKAGNRRLGSPLPGSVIVLRALQLGDMLCAVPAFRALRHALPGARITLVGLPWARAFMERFPKYINDFIEFPGYPGLPERVPLVRELPRFLERIQKGGYDLALQMQGSGLAANTLSALFGARRCAGTCVKGEFCPDRERFMSDHGNASETERCLRLMEFLGIPSKGDHLEFPLTGGDREDLRLLPGMENLKPHSYVCIHPGARFASRRWPLEKFAFVARRLIERGMKVVITGSADEGPIAGAVSRLIGKPHVNLAGRTRLGTLAALFEKAGLLISNDTGVSLIADALDVPGVVIAAGSDPFRRRPSERRNRRTVLYPVDCRPCSFLNCPIGHPCAERVSPEAILEQAEELLRSRLPAVARP